LERENKIMREKAKNVTLDGVNRQKENEEFRKLKA